MAEENSEVILNYVVHFLIRPQPVLNSAHRPGVNGIKKIQMLSLKMQVCYYVNK